MKAAAAERLPGGRMGWESLAAGAVLLASVQTEFPRSDGVIAKYAKTNRERLCAAARKLRCELELDVPPVRETVVDDVMVALGEDAPDMQACLRLRRLSEHLLDIADEAPIGPGTTRVTMAAAAVYAADRLTTGKALLQAELVEAGCKVLDTSKSRISSYSQRLYNAYESRHGTDDPAAVLERGRLQFK